VPYITDNLATPPAENTHTSLHGIIEKGPGQESAITDQEICMHMHSITGDFGMILRLLPDYAGGHPQQGYMLDICKACLKELPERPYSMAWPLRRH
jgi:hypothetical protein